MYSAYLIVVDLIVLLLMLAAGSPLCIFSSASACTAQLLHTRYKIHLRADSFAAIRA